MAGQEARIVELSWYGSAEVALPLGEAFHSRRLTLQSSQVGPGGRRDAAALDAMPGGSPRRSTCCAPRARPAGHAARSRFAELPTALPRLARHPDGALCVRIVYPN